MSDDLDEPLARRLRELPHESAPPAGLEDRVAASLRSRGLIGGRRTSPRWLGIAAAAVLIFGAGVWLGSRSGPGPSAPALGQYVLLLYEGPGFVSGDSAAEAARVEEYRDWTRSLAARRRFVAGEELGRPTWALEQTGGGVALDSAVEQLPTGFFIVAARDSADAVALAESCPHLRHGGRVIVRAIRRS